MVSKIICAVAILFVSGSVFAQEHKNFATYQRNDPHTRQMLDRANECYDMIWRAWFNEEPQPLPQPCMLTWKIGNISSQGVTSFQFGSRGAVPTSMEVYGTFEGVYYDTLPHECVHAVLANKLGFNPPRWMDEGAASTAESDETITNLENMLVQFIRQKRSFPVNQILLAKNYPDDVMPFYAQSVSLARFLLAKRGPDDFIRLARSHRQSNSWSQSFRSIYGYESIKALQDDWIQWVSNGSPEIHPDEDLLTRLKPIPRAQAPYRPTDQLQADMQLQQQIPQTQLTSAPMQNCPPVPAPQPGGQIRVEVDYQKLAAELAKMPELRGPAGPPGNDGSNGKVTEEQLQSLVEQTVQALAPTLDAIACKCDPNAKACNCSDHGQPQEPQPESGDGENASGNCECTDEQMDEIAQRAAAILKGSMPPTDAENRVLYFTSDSCKECGRANEMVQKLKSRGAPITIIKLSERDAETRGVPMIFVPKTERRIVGLNNVTAYLSSVTY